VGKGIPLGPYRLVRRLAKGGMAEIFLARKEGPEGFARDLVVKRILPHLSEDPEFDALFKEEARIVARLHHPNVVHVYDFGEDGGTAYLVMELVRGVDLRNLILRAIDRTRSEGGKGAIPPHHAAKLVSFVCEGLAHAHAATSEGGDSLGLVHRDVTPSNVLVSFDGAVKVTDFGVAKLQRAGGGRERTQVGRVRGKYAYLSPEQARGERLDERSDIFNVGILLFEAVTGTPLFPHADPKLAKSLSAGGRLPERERFDRIDPALSEIALRALAPRREDRYPDALAMRADLERFLRRWPEPSDTVELGRYVRDLFPDVMELDRRGPRAAGTVPLTGLVEPPSGTEVIEEGEPEDDAPFSVTGTQSIPPEDPLGKTRPWREVPETAVSLEDHAPITPNDPTKVYRATPPTEHIRPEPRRSRRGAVTLALLALVAIAVGVGFAVGMDEDAPPPAPPMEPVARAPDRAPPARAMLRLRTQPAGLEIRVDGRSEGPAPMVLELEPERHVIEAVRDDSSVVRTVLMLEAGEDRELLLEAPPPRHAELTLVSEPEGAEVEVDGERAGRTPLELEVEPGEHEVILTLAGREPVVREVEVEAGHSSTLSVILPPPEEETPSRRRRATGTLAIATTPWSEVYLGDRLLGTTPLTNVRLPAGTHTLTLRARGRIPHRRTVQIRPGRQTRLRANL